MFQEGFANLVAALGPRALPIALGIAVVGLILWAVGARISRSVFALVGVGLGAWLGLRLPVWLGWQIQPMAVGFGGALVLGLAGYWLHTVWVGLTLGTLLASAGAFVAWHRLAAGAEWSIPAFDPSQPNATIARDLWQSLPADFARVVAPYVAGGCAVIGALIAWLLPTLGRVLAFTLLGTLMLVTGGLAAAQLARPDWLAKLPPDTQTRGVALAILVTAGAVLQWTLCPRKPKGKDFSVGPGPAPARGPRDVRDLGPSKQGPLKLPKEARA
jgi:hypothetical protein